MWVSATAACGGCSALWQVARSARRGPPAEFYPFRAPCRRFSVSTAVAETATRGRARVGQKAVKQPGGREFNVSPGLLGHVWRRGLPPGQHQAPAAWTTRCMCVYVKGVYSARLGDHTRAGALSLSLPPFLPPFLPSSLPPSLPPSLPLYLSLALRRQQLCARCGRSRNAVSMHKAAQK